MPDDGALRRGALPRYKLLNDGTVKDLNTGLIWEVKCVGAGCPVLHDVEYGVCWSADLDGSGGTIWEWLNDINAEGGTGYAGHHDWRIPNVRELQSIVDYETSGPALNPIFGPISPFATPYWTSTTYLPSPSEAWAVGFFTGSVWDYPKGSVEIVRAVRGSPAYHFTLP
ncbi:MAG: DUF1566 domain-containing protein [Deltaproteobacteria bacterium]|nr:DUF1566 domain-containing protein [Deltaproteobacteria bacterium]